MSGAISVRQAIINTDRVLRTQLPAVATLAVDVEERETHFELTGEFLEDWPTPSIIREIGGLSH